MRLPVATSSPGSWLEMQNLRAHPRFTESEYAFQQGPQVNAMYTEVWEALLVPQEGQFKHDLCSINVA